MEPTDQFALAPSGNGADGNPRAVLVRGGHATPHVVSAANVAAQFRCGPGSLLFLTFGTSDGDALTIVLIDDQSRVLDQLGIGFVYLREAWLESVEPSGHDAVRFSYGVPWEVRVRARPQRFLPLSWRPNVMRDLPFLAPRWLAVRRLPRDQARSRD